MARAGWDWSRVSLEKSKERGGKIRLAHAKRKALSSGLIGLPLVEMLQEYSRQYDEAEWEDNWHEMKHLERLIADVKYRIHLGEKYDVPF